MIKEALEFLKSNFYNPPDVIEVAGRQFIRKLGGLEEVKADIPIQQAFHDQNGDALSLGTIAALSDFINRHQGKRSCQVIVSWSRATAYFDLDSAIPHDEFGIRSVYVTVPFVSQPGEFRKGYVEFMDLLDQWGEDCKDGEVIRHSCRSLRLVDQSMLKVSEKGPVISIETQSSKDLEGGAVSLPKEIVVNLPVGTREFKVPCVFLLRVLTEQGMQFILTRKANDGAWDLMLEKALAYLKEHNPNVFVTEGK